MVSSKQFDAMGIAFDFREQYTIARVPESFSRAEKFALELVYWLRPYVANKLHIDCWEVVLIAVSKNGRVVVFCDDSKYRDWLWKHFHQPSLGSAQFYDNVKSEQIIESIETLLS